MHVKELLDTLRRPEDAGPVPAEPDTEPASAVASDPEPDPPTPHRRPPRTAMHLAKIIAVTISLFGLFAALAIGSVVGQRHRAEPVTAAPYPGISGERALLPNLLNSVVPGTGRATPTSPTTRPGGATRLSAAETGAARPSGGLPPLTYVATGHTNAALVERFYQLIRTAPDRAYPLLDAALFGTTLGEFLRAFASVTDIEVLDIQEQGNDVLANIRMRLPDGSHLRVQQLLNVTSTLPQRIVGARLLSAQRS